MWAKFRNTYLADRRNRASLDAIERALFVVVLDESSPEHSFGQAGGDQIARSLIAGSGHNIWCDKSFNFVFYANGRCGVNVEHSWADAPVLAHITERAFGREFAGPGYDNVSGMNKALPGPKTDLKPPLRLQWDIDQEAALEIEASNERAQAMIRDLDIQVLPFDGFGKGFIKLCRVSPDAFVQMALQLAYYRDAGQFALTYESSMTRLFREGRTETVRPVTMASTQFVLAMQDPDASDDTRGALLRQAAEIHVDRYRSAMKGEGIDRHLFCLYVVSVWRNVRSEFLSEVLSVPWKLSTSQTPAQQTSEMDLRNNPNKVTGGGGFGPVADDGYGVSYIVSGEDKIFFHITSKYSSNATDSLRFARNVEQAMNDMRSLMIKLGVKSK